MILTQYPICLLRRFLYYCPVFLIYLFSPALAESQDETDTFTLGGNITYEKGFAVDAGFTVIAENQRVKEGWFMPPKAETRSDGSYTLSFLDIFGPHRTRVGDEIVVTVTNATSTQPLAETRYVVTLQDISNLEAKLDLQLPVELTPAIPPEQAETDTFTVTGVMRTTDGRPVGSGYEIVGENQRVKEGWFMPPKAETRSDGGYALSFLDIFGSRRTKIGDRIILTATEKKTGKMLVQTEYMVTPKAVENLEAKVDLDLLSLDAEAAQKMTLTLKHQQLPSDGTSQTTVTVSFGDLTQKFQDENLTVKAINGDLGQLTRNSQGVYTAIYTAPKLSSDQPLTETITARSVRLDHQISQTLTLQPLPSTVDSTTSPVSDEETTADEPTRLNYISWDVDRNQQVDIYDLVPVIQQWGFKKVGEGLSGDINQDGIVEATDATILVSHFGDSVGEPKPITVADFRVDFPVNAHLVPSTFVPEIGELMTVRVDVHVPLAVAEYVSGFEGTVNYDPTKLQLVEMTMGTEFFPAAWYTGNNSQHPIPLSPAELGTLFSPGLVTLAAAGFPRAKTVALGKTVAVLTFKALEQRQSQLYLSDFKLADQLGRSIATEVHPLYLMPWDLNGDGQVNLFDIATIRNEWEQIGKNLVADLNQDGQIDNFDYHILTGYLGLGQPVHASPNIDLVDSMALTIRTPQTELPKVGQKLKVQVVTDSVVNLASYQCTLNYNPDQLQFVEGELHFLGGDPLGFPTPEETAFFRPLPSDRGTAPDLDDKQARWLQPGAITFSSTTMGEVVDLDETDSRVSNPVPEKGISAGRLLASLAFIVLDRQDTTLHLSDMIAISTSAQPIATVAVPLNLPRPVTTGPPVDQVALSVDNSYLLVGTEVSTDLQVRLVDRDGALLTGETVTLTASEGQIQTIARDNGDGTYSAEYKALLDKPGVVQVIATTRNGKTGDLTLRFFQSVELTTKRPRISAQTSAKAEITITVRNTEGNLMLGQVVNLSASNGQIQTPADDNGDGTYTAQYTVTTNQTGTAHITATVGADRFNSIILQLVPVTTSPKLSKIKLIGETTLTLSQPATVEVQLLSPEGLPITDRAVTLDIEPSRKIRVDLSQKTDLEGKTQITFTAGQPGVKVVKAVVGNLTLNDGVAVIFTGEPKVGDIDLDGEVTIFDLVFAAGQFGQSSPNLTGDVNRDGVVDIFDLALIAVDFKKRSEPEFAAPALSKDRGLTTNIDLLAGQKLRIQSAIDYLIRRGQRSSTEDLALQILQSVLPPKQTQLLANYPNPFNPETWIPFELYQGGEVKLTIYDSTGSVVRRIDRGYLISGRYVGPEDAVYWNGQTETGETVSSGTYFYRLEVNSTSPFSETRKMAILK